MNNFFNKKDYSSNNTKSLLTKTNENLEVGDIESSCYNFFQYPEVPFPDALLRTAGEKRISNFLLYQLSYSELIFIDALWPDVNEDILDDVLLEFNKRNRTYGRN